MKFCVFIKLQLYIFGSLDYQMLSYLIYLKLVARGAMQNKYTLQSFFTTKYDIHGGKYWGCGGVGVWEFDAPQQMKLHNSQSN